MFIQPINAVLPKTNVVTLQKKSLKRDVASLRDTVYFQGKTSAYNEILGEIVNRTFLNDIDIEKTFSKLLNTISTNDKITKLKEFYFIEKLEREKGFRGMMRELNSANPKSEARKFLNIMSTNNTLAEQDNKPVLQLFDCGPQGFINCITDNPNSQRKVELMFMIPSDKPLSASVNLNSKGEYCLNQSRDCLNLYTCFYSSTGNRRFTILQSAGGEPDKTYFNKDGSKAFFKNWFFGGTPTTF